MEQYKKLFKSFYYAFKGITYVIRNERNFRIHLTCMIYMFSILSLTDWFVLDSSHWAILLLTSSSVLVAEIINTAVENAVNLASKEYSDFGRIAKDAAAGAVLLSAFFAVLTGIAVLFQKEAFLKMFNYFMDNPLMLMLFVFSIVPASIFIFWGNPFSKRK